MPGVARVAAMVLVAVSALGSSAPAINGFETGDRVRREWWPGGAMRLEVHYRNGVFHGTYRAWHENGRTRSGTSPTDARKGRSKYGIRTERCM